MAMNSKRGLSAEQRRALRLIARNPDGCAESVFLAFGFNTEMLALLVLQGLVTAGPETERTWRPPH